MQWKLDMRGIVILCCLIWSSLAFTTKAGASSETTDTIVEGTLTQVSNLPAAATNPYPDCYYTAVLDVAKIVSGHSTPKRLVVVLPGFFSRQYAPEANYKIGDKVRATVVPFASMPEKVRQTQQADEVEDVTLPFYFPQKISSIQGFAQTTVSVPFADKDEKVPKVVTFQPVDQQAQASRQEQMRHDLENINTALAQHGGDWRKWYLTQSGRREQYKRRYEAKSQKWVGDSFFSAGYVDNDEVYSPDFVRSLVAFKNYLAARNVDLIVVRIPNKGEVVEDLFTSAPKDEVYNPYLLRMYKELLEADVEVITDVIPKAKEKRLSFPLMYWYQDFDQNHPAEGVSWVIAEELAQRIGRYERVKSSPKKTLTLSKSSITQGWLSYKWPTGNPKFNPGEFTKFTSVTDDKGKFLELTQGKLSPVLVVGSSFIATPSLYKAASIPHYLAYLSGIVPDIVQRNDADFMMPRSVARAGDELLSGRSVCIFPFVPWVPYAALASVPIFDPSASTKTLLITYTDEALQKAVGVKGDGDHFEFASHSLIVKPSPDGDATASMQIALPDVISQYPYFVLSLEFDSRERSTVAVKYAGQSDSIKRIDNHPEKEELFVFMTKEATSATVTFNTNGYMKEAPKITAIKVFGVKQPVYYKSYK